MADDRCIALVFPIAFKSCEVSYKLCGSAAQRSIGDWNMNNRITTQDRRLPRRSVSYGNILLNNLATLNLVWSSAYTLRTSRTFLLSISFECEVYYYYYYFLFWFFALCAYNISILSVRCLFVYFYILHLLLRILRRFVRKAVAAHSPRVSVSVRASEELILMFLLIILWKNTRFEWCKIRPQPNFKFIFVIFLEFLLFTSFTCFAIRCCADTMYQCY